MYKTVHFTKI